MKRLRCRRDPPASLFLTTASKTSSKIYKRAFSSEDKGSPGPFWPGWTPLRNPCPTCLLAGLEASRDLPQHATGSGASVVMEILPVGTSSVDGFLQRVRGGSHGHFLSKLLWQDDLEPIPVLRCLHELRPL
jgi:hypothetical protein